MFFFLALSASTQIYQNYFSLLFLIFTHAITSIIYTFMLMKIRLFMFIVLILYIESYLTPICRTNSL